MLVRLYDVLPDIAEKETRSVDVRASAGGMPLGNYGFLAYFCPDPTCDCQRVSVQVVRQEVGVEAMISHAFERGDPDPVRGRTYLDPMHGSAPHAPALLDLFLEVMERDPAYALRLEHHYAQVKQAVGDPHHPCHERIARLRPAPNDLGTRLQPGTVGTRKNPAMFRVPDEATAERVAAAADRVGYHYVMEMAPGKPADLSDVDLIGVQRSAPVYLSRHERRAWEKQNRRP